MYSYPIRFPFLPDSYVVVAHLSDSSPVRYYVYCVQSYIDPDLESPVPSLVHLYTAFSYAALKDYFTLF